MKQEYRRLAIFLCLLLTALVIYIPGRFSLTLWADNGEEEELRFRLLAAVQAPGGYVSPESHLWLITKPEQIDQVRFFAIPETIAQLEGVDYGHYIVVALLVSANTTLMLDRITNDDGVLTVYVHDVTPPVTPPTTSAYRLLEIPRNRTTEALRKLVLHMLPTSASPSSPLPGSDTPQLTSPIN